MDNTQRVEFYLPKKVAKEIVELPGAKKLDRQQGDLPERWVYSSVYYRFWLGSDLCRVEGNMKSVERALALVGHSLAEFEYTEEHL